MLSARLGFPAPGLVAVACSACVEVPAAPTISKLVMVCWLPLGSVLVLKTSSDTRPPLGVMVVTKVPPRPSLVVITAPTLASESVMELPTRSVVVMFSSSSLSLLPPEVAPGAGAEVMISPPELTWTLAKGEVVVTASPLSLVEVTTAAGTRVEVVNVLPWSFVEVTGTSTLSLAEVANADVVTGTTDPPSWVEEIITGISTPVWVPAAEVSSLLPVSTALVIAGGVLTTVLPSLFVVVSAGGLDASVVEDATREVVWVLPESSVVVTATVVPPVALDPIEEDVNSWSSLEDSALDVTDAPEDSVVKEASVDRAELLPSVVTSEVCFAEVSLAVSDAALDLDVSSSLAVVLAGDV